jgi:hypothetical protein
MGGHIARMGRKRNSYKILVRNAENLTETGLETAYWIHVAHDRDQWRSLVNTVMNLQFHTRPGILN